MAEVGVRSDGGGSAGTRSDVRDEIVLRVLDQVQLNMLKFQAQFNELSAKIAQLEEVQKKSTTTPPNPVSTQPGTDSENAEPSETSEKPEAEPLKSEQELQAVSAEEIMRLDGRIDVIVKELSILRKDLMIDNSEDKSLLLETSWKGGLNSTSMMVQAGDDLDEDVDPMDESAIDESNQLDQSASLYETTNVDNEDASNYVDGLGNEEEEDENEESMTIQPEIYLDQYLDEDEDDEDGTNNTNDMNQMAIGNGDNGMDVDQDDDDDDDDDDIQYEPGSEDEQTRSAYFSYKGQSDNAIEYKIIKATGKHQCPLFPVCQVECLSRRNLMRHYYNTHASTVTFQCPICGIGYARKDNLSKHYKKKHESIYGSLPNPAAQARPRVEYEDQQQRRMLIQSQRQQGMGMGRVTMGGVKKSRPGPVGPAPSEMISGGHARPHKCYICGITYNWRKNLNQHMKVKHGILMPPGTRGPQTTPLVKPRAPAKRTMVTNYVTCRLCPTSFRTTEELARHYAVRHRQVERPPPAKAPSTPKSNTSSLNDGGHNECPICHKLFSNRGLLKRHVSMHRATSTPITKTITVAQTSITPTSSASAAAAEIEEAGVAGVLGPDGVVHDKQCRVCFKEFTRREHVKRHMKLHSGQERYACIACDKIYSRKDQLRQHQRQTHGQVLDLEPMDNGDSEYQD